MSKSSPKRNEKNLISTLDDFYCLGES